MTGNVESAFSGERLCLLISTMQGVTLCAVDRGDYVIGRAPDADIVLQDRSVSRKHARLALGAGQVTLTHLEGVHGTRVDGARLEPGAPVGLPLGVAVEMGATTLILQRERGVLGDDGAPRWTSRVAPASGSAKLDPIVCDESMIRLFRTLDLVAPSMLNVLILGETGAGKEVVAETLHARSERAREPFVELNCAAVPEMLFESELFGHEKGAFTGAVERKEGIFESADGGTVFLDEVGEVPQRLQAKLLRVLETREVQRLGANRGKFVDVRFIAATNRDLKALVADGRFRQDLYFRLNGVSLTLPPLRKRRADILPLAERFLQLAASKRKRGPRVLTIGKEAARHLLFYSWPGNVRELKNAIERAAVVCQGEALTPEDLDLEEVTDVSRKAPLSDPSLFPGPPSDAAWALEPPSSSGLTSAPPSGGGALAAQVEAFEKKLILDALEQNAGNQTKAAQLLGVSRRVLLLRLEQYSITRPRK
jgi:transcriptional regulator with GAF, ATPase, and Fis domain